MDAYDVVIGAGPAGGNVAGRVVAGGLTAVVVEDMDDSGQVRWLDGAGIGLVRGRGRITGEQTVAQAWKALGSAEVTVVERGEGLPSRLEPFAGELIEELGQ